MELKEERNDHLPDPGAAGVALTTASFSTVCAVRLVPCRFRPG